MASPRPNEEGRYKAVCPPLAGRLLDILLKDTGIRPSESAVGLEMGRPALSLRFLREILRVTLSTKFEAADMCQFTPCNGSCMKSSRKCAVTYRCVC